jgi:hypothetical protein
VGQGWHDKSRNFFSMEKEMKIINWEQNFYTPEYQQLKEYSLLAIGCRI